MMKCDRDFLTASRENPPPLLEDLSENQTPTSCCLAVPALPLGLAATSNVPSGFKSPINLEPLSSSPHAGCSCLTVSVLSVVNVVVSTTLEPNDDRGVIASVEVYAGDIISSSDSCMGLSW